MSLLPVILAELSYFLSINNGQNNNLPPPPVPSSMKQRFPKREPLYRQQIPVNLTDTCSGENCVLKPIYTAKRYFGWILKHGTYLMGFTTTSPTSFG